VVDTHTAQANTGAPAGNGQVTGVSALVLTSPWALEQDFEFLDSFDGAAFTEMGLGVFTNTTNKFIAGPNVNAGDVAAGQFHWHYRKPGSAPGNSGNISMAVLGPHTMRLEFDGTDIVMTIDGAHSFTLSAVDMSLVTTTQLLIKGGSPDSTADGVKVTAVRVYQPI
jgi:hypothetical protein